MYMIMPSFVLSLIALLMFWLPPESGEKVSLGITVFLAFSVLMFSLSDDLPESSDSFPIIGKLISRKLKQIISNNLHFHRYFVSYWYFETAKWFLQNTNCCVLTEQIPYQIIERFRLQTNMRELQLQSYLKLINNFNRNVSFVVPITVMNIFNMIHSSILGFYLMFVMNSTAIWLLITVAILNVHHQDKIKQPPAWLQSLVLKALAKLMCMSLVFSESRENNDLLKCENNVTSAHCNKHRPNMWILIARVFDRLCLIVFVFVDLLAFVVLMCHYPSPITVHPKHFQRSEVLWNLTDF